MASTPDPAPELREARRLRILMGCAMIVAFAVRVAFLADKPFWRDEAWVALLVDDPLRVATDARSVPIGFVLLTRLFAAIPVLAPEITYRVLPLLCGMAVLPLLARLSVALGATRRTALAVVWLAVGFQPFVYYSRELKSYELDVLAAVLLPLLGLQGFAASATSALSRRALIACVAVAPWVSFGSVFPISALLAWGWLAWWKNAARVQRRDWMLATLAFVLSFAALYVVVLSVQVDSPRLRSYWEGHLIAEQQLSWLVAIPVAAWRYASVSTLYFFAELWPAFVAVAAVGAWTWPREGRAFLAWLGVATAAACVVAAVADRYLLAQGRLLLFAAPVMLMWSANGLQAIARRLREPLGAAIVLGIPVLLSLYWSAQSIDHRVHPRRTNWTRFFRYDVLQDVNLAIAEADRQIPAGDPLLVERKCAYAFQFYAHGRLPQAVYCERYCKDFRSIARKWAAGVDHRGWVMLGDEDINSLGRFFDKAGFDHRERVRVRGVRVWELERRPGTKKKLRGSPERRR